MPWFAWVLLAYFWRNMADTIRQIGSSFEITPKFAGAYLVITGFMTWAIITQMG